MKNLGEKHESVNHQGMPHSALVAKIKKKEQARTLTGAKCLVEAIFIQEGWFQLGIFHSQ
jgi:hypothetical protein